MLTLIRKTLHRIKKDGLNSTIIHIKRYLMRLLYTPFGRRPPKRVLSFEAHLVDHCNLNCWGCDNFSPLSDEWFADLDTFAKDFNRMSELFGRKITLIKLLGGEPLLHPELEKFFPIVRGAFPFATTTIMVITNGTLLGKKEPSFWRACAAQNIDIVVTVYPNMEKQFEEARDKGESFGVKVYPFGDRFGATKTSLHLPFDLSGSQPLASNFLKCLVNECTTLRKGRIYPCSHAGNVYIFNKYFPEHALQETEKDSIDIYSAKSSAEIFDFLSRPIPLCRFCFVRKFTDTGSWRQSKKDVKEWTI
jgi:MoaA/NifB/PqqE/SkfB family radical SAM enzyme